MRIKATLLILFGVLSLCQAQLKITLQFESAAPREVFVASELPKSAPSSSTKAAGVSLDYTLAAFGGTDRIYVWDHSTNNIASKAIKEISNGIWAPKAADFSTLGTVTVHVEHRGLPVQAAKVNLGGKGKAEEKLLDPSGNGDVQFFGFPSGDLHVKVAYNTVDKKEGSQEQIFPVAVKRDKAEPVLTVAIPEEVATVAAAPTSAPAAGGQKPTGAKGQPEEASNPAGKLVIFVIAIAIIGGVGYWILQMAKNNPKAFEEHLTKLGVQVPKPQDPADQAIPVQPLAPAPPAPKIMLDDADPTPLGSSVAVAAPKVSTGEPALINDSGQRVSLSDGETVVGREDGLGLSLAGESTVSRRHATLIRSGAGTVLKDLGSTNGTFVNGTRLQGEVPLKPGDQVMFGSVRFRYEG